MDIGNIGGSLQSLRRAAHCRVLFASLIVALCSHPATVSGQPITDYEVPDAMPDDGIWREVPAAPQPLKKLRIASWNLSPGFGFRTKSSKSSMDKREETKASKALEETGGRWRHTFGSQRRNRPKTPNFAIDDLAADVVLLQGIRSVHATRKMFPARDWRLIVSRQILKISDLGLTAQSARRDDYTTTAVAVRFQRNVRITGQQHLGALSGKAADMTAHGVAPTASHATAVRLLVDGQAYWLVSVDLRQHCLVAEEACPAQGALQTWFEQRRSDRIAVAGAVIGGPGATQSSMARSNTSTDEETEQNAKTEASANLDACANQGVRFDGSIDGSIETLGRDIKCVRMFTLALSQ